jgi:hypothetical protein
MVGMILIRQKQLGTKNFKSDKNNSRQSVDDRIVMQQISLGIYLT